MKRKRSVSYKPRSEAIKCCFQERLTFICTRTGHVHFLTFDKVYFVLCIVWIFQIILSLSPSNQSRRLSRLWRDNPSVWLQRLSLSHKLEKISTIGIMAEKLILIVYLYLFIVYLWLVFCSSSNHSLSSQPNKSFISDKIQFRNSLNRRVRIKKGTKPNKKPSRESFWDFKEKYIHKFEDSEEDRRDNLTG